MGSIARTVMGRIKFRLVRRLMPEPKMSCFYSSGTYFGGLSRLAKLTGQSCSDLLRKLLDDYIKSEKGGAYEIKNSRSS